MGVVKRRIIEDVTYEGDAEEFCEHQGEEVQKKSFGIIECIGVSLGTMVGAAIYDYTKHWWRRRKKEKEEENKNF